MRPLIRMNTSSKCHLSPGPGMPASQFVSVSLAELEAPSADRFKGHNYATHPQYLFDVAVAESEAEVEAHAVADDFWWEAVTAVKRSRGSH